MKKHYVYITTNLINGKQYVGDHSTNRVNDSYLGSGIILHKAIEKYRRRNFKRKILEFFDTKEKAFYAQEKYINEYNTLIPNGYNLDLIGGSAPNKIFSKETIEKRSKDRIGFKHSKETKEKIRQSLLGVKHTEERRKNISEAHKGKDFSPNFRKEKLKFIL